MARIILDDDEDLTGYVKRYLEDTVQQRVKALLEHQLKGIVAAEMARLKLLDLTHSVPLETAITDTLMKLVDDRVRVVVPPQVAESLRKKFS